MRIKFNKAQMLVRSVSRFIKPYTYHLVIFAFVICAGSSVSAAEYTFQNAGGDLSTLSNWGVSSLGSSDIGVINQGGTYTLSADLQLSQLKIDTTSKCTFDFTDGNHSLRLSTADYPISITQEKIDAILKGGVWDFSNNDFRGTKNDTKRERELFAKMLLFQGPRL